MRNFLSRGNNQITAWMCRQITHNRRFDVGFLFHLCHFTIKQRVLQSFLKMVLKETGIVDAEFVNQLFGTKDALSGILDFGRSFFLLTITIRESCFYDRVAMLP